MLWNSYTERSIKSGIAKFGSKEVFTMLLGSGIKTEKLVHTAMLTNATYNHYPKWLVEGAIASVLFTSATHKC